MADLGKYRIAGEDSGATYKFVDLVEPVTDEVKSVTAFQFKKGVGEYALPEEVVVVPVEPINAGTDG